MRKLWHIFKRKRIYCSNTDIISSTFAKYLWMPVLVEYWKNANFPNNWAIFRANECNSGPRLGQDQANIMN